MKTPKLTEMNWQMIKIHGGGALGIAINYAFLFGEKGRTFCRKNKTDTDLAPHDDLVKLINEMKPIVAKLENFDYGRKMLELPQFEPTKIQQQLTEATVQEAIKQITVTGVHISEKKQSEGVIITYNKVDENEETMGHSTSWINLSAENNGMEEELAEILDSLKKEAYEYLFKEKHADFEQITMDIPDADIVEEDDTESDDKD